MTRRLEIFSLLPRVLREHRSHKTVLPESAHLRLGQYLAGKLRHESREGHAAQALRTKQVGRMVDADYKVRT
jgi:hypothetical protein